MIVRRSLIIWGLLVVWHCSSQGEFTKSAWRYHREIRAESLSGFSRVVLDAETFDHSQQNLADLRLVGPDGEEWPYQLIRGTEWRVSDNRAARLLNNSRSSTGFSVLLLDLGKRGFAHNVVTLNTPSHNFRRRVEVYGSDDAISWFLLRNDATIFDFSSPDDSVRQTRIRYPESVYRFITLHIINGNEDPIVIRDASIIVETEPTRTLRSYNASVIASFIDQKKKQSIIIIDAHYRNIPITGVTLLCTQENFYRTIEVYAGNDTSAMKGLGRDVIYRFVTRKFVDEKLSVDVRTTPARFMKLIISNKDDRPISVDVDHVTALEYSIVFGSTSGPLELYFGNPTAALPSYDLERTLQYVDLESAHPAVLGPVAVNTDFVTRDERPWSERNPVLLWGAFGVAFVILGGLIFRLAKKGHSSTQ